MGKSQRIKGHSFERATAIKLRSIWPDSKRGFQCRNNKDLNPDVDIPEFFIECKAHKRVNIRAALTQAETKRKESDKRIPVAVCKDDHKPVVVALYFDDFVKLLEKWYSKVKDDNNREEIDTDKEPPKAMV